MEFKGLKKSIRYMLAIKNEFRPPNTTPYSCNAVEAWVSQAYKLAKNRARRIHTPVFVTGTAVERCTKENGYLSPKKLMVLVEFFVPPKGGVCRPVVRVAFSDCANVTHLTAARKLGASIHLIKRVDRRCKYDLPEQVVCW